MSGRGIRIETLSKRKRADAKRALFENAALGYEATVTANAPEDARVMARATLARAAIDWVRSERDAGRLEL